MQACGVVDRLSLRPDAVRRAATRCTWVADDLETAIDHLVDGLATMGDVCGDDEAGRAFAADHDAARTRIEAAVANLTRCARGMANGLLVTAATFEDAEAASTIPVQAS